MNGKVPQELIFSNNISLFSQEIEMNVELKNQYTLDHQLSVEREYFG